MAPSLCKVCSYPSSQYYVTNYPQAQFCGLQQTIAVSQFLWARNLVGLSWVVLAHDLSWVLGQRVSWNWTDIKHGWRWRDEDLHPSSVTWLMARGLHSSSHGPLSIWLLDMAAGLLQSECCHVCCELPCPPPSRVHATWSHSAVTVVGCTRESRWWELEDLKGWTETDHNPAYLIPVS